MFWTTSWDDFVPLFLLLNLCVVASPASEDRHMWEGSDCVLKGGRAGKCIKIVDCPEKMQEIRQGNYTSEGRCGFSGSDEIVCCEKKVTIPSSRVNEERPAVAACNTYKNWWPTRAVPAVFKGVEVEPHEFSQVVALGYPAGPDDELVIDGKQYICGGTLIAEQWILTAAHCVSNIQGFVPVEVVIFYDATDLVEIQTGKAKRFSISRIVKHPEYRRSYHYHDIALIQLKDRVSFSEYIRPACLMAEPLPTSSTDGQNISLTILGWGAIDFDGTRSTKLLKAESLRYLEIDECSMSYRNLRAKIPNGLDEGMICVTDPNTERKSDTCRGDSGGPLFLGWNIFPQVVGVTSFGQACGAGTPGVYASVHRYLDWIEAQVWPVGVPNRVGCSVLQIAPSLIDYILDTTNKTSCDHDRDLCLCIRHLL